MACYNPIRAFRTPHGVVFSELRRYDILARIDLPCGQCIGCRLRRAKEWATRCTHEAQCHEDNCFLTLTYSDENLPADGSLRHRDFQLFMKRLRKVSPRVRFFMCGEYGPETLRPHYHALLFGRGFYDRKYFKMSGSREKIYTSKELDSLWKVGYATVQDFTPATAAYCARYIVDKINGDLAEAHYKGRVPEYCACSLRPGIGSEWYSRFGTAVANRDFAVVDGQEVKLPRYYDKLSKRNMRVDVDAVEYQRYLDSLKSLPDSTPERLAVREAVALSRANFLKRNSV